MLPGPSIPPQAKQPSANPPAVQPSNNIQPETRPSDLAIPSGQLTDNATPPVAQSDPTPTNLVMPSTPEVSRTQPVAGENIVPPTPPAQCTQNKVPLALRKLLPYNAPGLQEETVTSSPVERRITRQSKKQ